MARSGCVYIPHGPDEACTCTGCWACQESAREWLDLPDTPENCLIGLSGRVIGCSCDIDWEHVYGNHTSTCGGQGDE